ncbi:chemerin-like receptor 2 [Ambystoma mexicanum]|uniref:chemerin-like receptor 2 n=1 Tax=Ambystoma mexicanum TaxID=8296 RepID=UPI0037E999C7
MESVTTTMNTAPSLSGTMAMITENMAATTENATSENMNATLLFYSTAAPNPLKTTRVLRLSSNCGDEKSIVNAMSTLSVVLYSIAFLLGLTGNGLVLWVTGFKMKKTVKTVWFLNLAAADFIFIVFLPLSIASTAMDFQWSFGNFLCKLNSTIAFLNMYASVFFLTIISIDRCVSVVYPVWSQNHRTYRLSSIIAVVTWSLALAISSPVFAFRDTVIPKNSSIIVCFNNYALSARLPKSAILALIQMRHKAMVISRFVIGFLIPFVLIIICYGIISLKIIKNKMAAKFRKPFWIMTAVIVSFFLCWLPFHIFAFLEISSHKGGSCTLSRTLKVGFPIATNLAYLHSCINPILYVLLGQDAKNTIRKSILLVFESAFKEEASQVTRNSRNQSKSMTETDVSATMLSTRSVQMQQL